MVHTLLVIRLSLLRSTTLVFRTLNFRVLSLRKKEKREKLKTDIKAMFNGPVEIQALFICEFGIMHKDCLEKTEVTHQIFEELLCDIDLSHLVIKALPPYVAVVDPNYWDVLDCFKCGNLCTEKSNFAMMLSLEHTLSGVKIGVANCHIPSSTATSKRKTDTIGTLCTQLTTLNNLSGWIIGGDCNLDKNTMNPGSHHSATCIPPEVSADG